MINTRWAGARAGTYFRLGPTSPALREKCRSTFWHTQTESTAPTCVPTPPCGYGGHITNKWFKNLGALSDLPKLVKSMTPLPSVNLHEHPWSLFGRHNVSPNKYVYTSLSENVPVVVTLSWNMQRSINLETLFMIQLSRLSSDIKNVLFESWFLNTF